MLTAAQICTLARSIAKCNGFTVQSGQMLNLVLDDLCLKRDLKINRETDTITVSSGSNGPFNLENTYLRTYDLFFEENGLPFFLKPISMEQYDAEFKDPQVANYPYEFATDISPLADDPSTGIPLLYIYPQSSASIDLTHRYMIRRAQISSPESSSSIPWFLDQEYLMHQTAAKLMKITDDDRWVAYEQMAEKMLQPWLIMEGDEQQVVKEVKLDPRRFRMTRSLKKTKVTD